MFTPTPSPLPFAKKAVGSSESVTGTGQTLTVPSVSPSPPPSPPRSYASKHSPLPRAHKAKLRVARRTRWTILLVPAVLILITASTRYLSHPAVLDILSAHKSADFGSWSSSLTDWKFHDHRTKHRREPVPEPKPDVSQTLSSMSVTTVASLAASALTGALAAASSTGTPTPTAVSINLPTIPASPPVLPTPFPQPFDQLEQNFSTQGCQSFFLGMLQSETFRSCRPFSLLLQTSYAFSEAQSNLTEMNAIVWGTCNTTIDEDTCISDMAAYLTQMQSVCSKDIANGVAAATEAVAGLEAYSLMRTAACQGDASTNAYCFIEAVQNTNPSDLFFYNLPLGLHVPNSSTPSCDACTQTLMALYDQAQANLPALQATYDDAAKFAASHCGSDYVAVASGAAGRRVVEGHAGLVALVSVAVVMSLL